MNDSVLLQIPRRFARAWNRRDVEAVFDDYADDASFVNTFGSLWKGKERFVAEHAARFEKIFVDSSLEFDEILVRHVTPNSAVIHARWHMTGHASPGGHW